MGLTLPLAADLLVAVLLVASITSSLRLSRRMAKLRADETAMRATIGELLVATDTAERAVAGLRATLAEGERTLQERLRDAERFSNRLAAQVEAGEAVMARVARVREATRAVAAQAGLAPELPPRSEGGGVRDTLQAAQEIAERSRRRLEDRAA